MAIKWPFSIAMLVHQRVFVLCRKESAKDPCHLQTCHLPATEYIQIRWPISTTQHSTQQLPLSSCRATHLRHLVSTPYLVPYLTPPCSVAEPWVWVRDTKSCHAGWADVVWADGWAPSIVFLQKFYSKVLWGKKDLQEFPQKWIHWKKKNLAIPGLLLGVFAPSWSLPAVWATPTKPLWHLDVQFYNFYKHPKSTGWRADF